jgi:glutaconate CoA-transferase subunit A
VNKELERQVKLTSLTDAVGLVENGSTVAIGGSIIRRHPMAFVREMIRQGKKDLRLIGWNNGADFDMLIGAGCTNKVETAYVGLSMFGMALNFRRAVESGAVTMVEHSETTAIDRFKAAASGLTFIPSKTPLASGMETECVENSVHIKCPFTGEDYIALQAWTPDVAVVHMHMADRYGNILLDNRRMMDNEIDVFIAKSAKKVIVTVEQIVSEEYVYENPHLNVLPKCWVDAVVETPYGAHPGSCDTRYDYDAQHFELYREMSRTAETFKAYLDEWVYGCKTEMDYLNKIGIARLLELTRARGVRS